MLGILQLKKKTHTHTHTNFIPWAELVGKFYRIECGETPIDIVQNLKIIIPNHFHEQLIIR